MEWDAVVTESTGYGSGRMYKALGLEASTAVIGLDNILIKGRPSVVLPGVNLLLMSE
ncbi:MAG: hypothetical protein U5L00_01120 [Desulfovermiculus sp.]|nr:hypothetical protein [Desulfovermiculus sp.]